MKINNKEFKLGERTYIMGILNVTPDSFSDGGCFNQMDMARRHVSQMIEQGADIIDVGGESTRPNYISISEEEEINRVVPVIEMLHQEFDIPISIDTYKSKVAEAAIQAGAGFINDIWGLKRSKDMANIIAKYHVPCCLMHNRENNNYANLMVDMITDLNESLKIAKQAGIDEESIIIDPGIGFAKTYEQNLYVMNHLEELRQLKCPILLGTSRKSMIGLALNVPARERVEGTIATTVMGILKGACDFVRVHDVLENARAAKMIDTIMKVGMDYNG